MARRLSAVLVLAAVSRLAAGALTGNDSVPLYKNANASVDDRIADLLKRMTIEDKTAQLLQADLSSWMNITTGAFTTSALEWSMKYRAGQMYAGQTTSWELLSSGIKLAQDYLVHNTTLGIPTFVQCEGIHGLVAPNATIFNSPIGQACSWNPELVEVMAKAIAKESSALGVNQLFAPLGDLARELRYGRVEETYGEVGDVTHTPGLSRMALAHFVIGFVSCRRDGLFLRQGASVRQGGVNREALCRLCHSGAGHQYRSRPRRTEGAVHHVFAFLQARHHRRRRLRDHVGIPLLRWRPGRC